MITEIKSKDTFDNAIKDANLTVVDLYAKWCGPCKQISPVLEQWSKDMSNVQFLKVDVDVNEDIVMKYQIQAMPTFLFFKLGELVDRMTGANVNKLQQLIEKHK